VAGFVGEVVLIEDAAVLVFVVVDEGILAGADVEVDDEKGVVMYEAVEDGDRFAERQPPAGEDNRLREVGQGLVMPKFFHCDDNDEKRPPTFNSLRSHIYMTRQFSFLSNSIYLHSTVFLLLIKYGLIWTTVIWTINVVDLSKPKRKCF
jgi:hypothetical protein